MPILKITHFPKRSSRIGEENAAAEYEREQSKLAAKRQAFQDLSKRFTAHHFNSDKSEGTDDYGKLYLGGRGRIKQSSDSWDPILHDWRHEPSEEERLNRELSTSAGDNRDLSGNLVLQQAEKQHLKRIPYPPHIGKYNPITNEWIIAPSDKRFHNREKERQMKRHVGLHAHAGSEHYDLINHKWTTDCSDLSSYTQQEHVRQREEQERKFGRYDPIKGVWQAEPNDPAVKVNDYLVQKGKKRLDVPGGLGQYDPVKNEWTVPPEEDIFSTH